MNNIFSVKSQMEYKASLDTLSKIITGVLIIIFFAIELTSLQLFSGERDNSNKILIQSGTLLFFILVIAGCYLFSTKKYLLNGKELIIVRPIKERIILLSDIEEIRPVAKGEMRWTIRTFGVGGLFGYYGKFYNRKFGSMTWYTTQLKNRIFIRIKSGEKIIITPDDISLAVKLNTEVLRRQQLNTSYV